VHHLPSEQAPHHHSSTSVSRVTSLNEGDPDDRSNRSHAEASPDGNARASLAARVSVTTIDGEAVRRERRPGRDGRDDDRPTPCAILWLSLRLNARSALASLAVSPHVRWLGGSSRLLGVGRSIGAPGCFGRVGCRGHATPVIGLRRTRLTHRSGEAKTSEPFRRGAAWHRVSPFSCVSSSRSAFRPGSSKRRLRPSSCDAG
jgi:hypothetical protein